MNFLPDVLKSIWLSRAPRYNARQALARIEIEQLYSDIGVCIESAAVDNEFAASVEQRADELFRVLRESLYDNS